MQWLARILSRANRSRGHATRQARRRPSFLVSELEERLLLSSFTVINTADSGPGSLRQAILDANASLGADTLEFNIPPSDSAFNLAGNGFGSQWWTIRLASPLPMLTDSGTQVLGFTQKMNVADMNAGLVGTGGTVGVDGTALPQYERPEIAIDANDFDAIAVHPGASNILIEGLAIYNAADAITVPALNPVTAGSGRIIRSMLIGTLPDGSDPGLAHRNTMNGIAVLDGGSSLTVQRSYMAYNGQSGVAGAASASQLVVEFNEVFGNGWNSNDSDGVEIGGVGSTIRFNLIQDNVNDSSLDFDSGHGVELGPRGVGTVSNGNNSVVNNTIRGNISAGVAVRSGSSNNLIQRNIITRNVVGISVNTEDGTATAGNTISENRVFENVGLGLDLHATASTTPPFDGVTLNDPWDADGGANAVLNFPVMTDARLTGGSLILEGLVAAGAQVEFYVADGDPSGFGEGTTFIGRFTEGAGQDGDLSIGQYGPTESGVVVATGVVTASRFRFTMTVPGGVREGTVLTSVAIVGGNSSEFGPNRTVRGAGSISGTVYSDANNNGVRNPGELGIAGARITLHGTDTQGNPIQQEQVTGPNGSYSFGDLAAGTYTVSEAQPDGFLDGTDTVGTLGGAGTGDRLTGIVIAEGQVGTSYDFGELAPSRLAGFVFLDLDNDGNRGGESGISGVRLTLTGTNDRGQNVGLESTTAEDGAFSFENLRPGAYSIRETQPTGFADGKDSVGTQGGIVAADEIQVLLPRSGEDGVENNFGELVTLSISCVQHTFTIYTDVGQRLQVRALNRTECKTHDIVADSLEFGGARTAGSRAGRKGDMAFYFYSKDTTLVPDDVGVTGDRIARFTGRFRDGTVFAVDLPVLVLKFSAAKFRRRH